MWRSSSLWAKQVTAKHVTYKELEVYEKILKSILKDGGVGWNIWLVVLVVVPSKADAFLHN
jgi:hypothetical protein